MSVSMTLRDDGWMIHLHLALPQTAPEARAGYFEESIPTGSLKAQSALSHMHS